MITMPLLSQTCAAVPVGLFCTIIVSLLTKKPGIETVRMVESWHDSSDYYMETKVEVSH